MTATSETTLAATWKPTWAVVLAWLVLVPAGALALYGVYATGWIKRGPVGLIGHTKSDAMETVRHLINDLGNWWRPESAR